MPASMTSRLAGASPDTEGDQTVTTTEPATHYHETIDDLRRDLVRSYTMWERTVAEYRDPVMRARAANEQVPEPIRDAYMASLMAMNYSYTIAALLKVAQNEFSDEVSRRLAFKADDVLTNGDDYNLNADVMPGEGK